jgi:hypothetical protein
LNTKCKKFSPKNQIENIINEKMMIQTLSELVKTADTITIEEVKGKKVTLKVSWFDLKGVRKTKKFSFNEKDEIEF